MTERERELEQEVAMLKRQMEFLQPIVDAYVGCKGQKQAKDRVLRAEVVATVRTAIMDVLEGDDEVSECLRQSGLGKTATCCHESG